MKRLILLSLFGAALAINTTAMAADGQANDKTYYQVQLGLADADAADGGLAFIGAFGYKLPNVNKYLSVEGEFTTPLIDPEVAGIDVSYFTLGGYGTFTIPLDDKLNLRARAGLNYVDQDTAFGSDSSIEVGFGVGITYGYSKGKNIIAEFTSIDELTHISAGMQFNF